MLGNSVSSTKNAKISAKTLLKLVQIEFLGKFGAQKWSKPPIFLSIGPDSPIFYQSTGPEHSKYVRHVGVGGVGKFCVKDEKHEKREKQY
jgi:hypothetical protein